MIVLLLFCFVSELGGKGSLRSAFSMMVSFVFVNVLFWVEK